MMFWEKKLGKNGKKQILKNGERRKQERKNKM